MTPEQTSSLGSLMGLNLSVPKCRLDIPILELQKLHLYLFFPRDAMLSADYAVCLSVLLPCTRRYYVETAKCHQTFFNIW